MLGLGASLFPQELLVTFDSHPSDFSVLLVSLLGALYLGFALLNWMARANLIGGIYSRPVAIGNFVHFFAATIVLIKQLVAGPTNVAFVLGTIAYVLFAVGFGYVAFAGGERCA